MTTGDGGGLRRRSLWALATESLDSLGTVVFAVWLARQVPADQFGAYAIGLSIQQLAVGLATGAGSLTLLVRLGNSDLRMSRQAAGDVTGVTLATALLPVGAYLVIASVAGSALATTSLAFAAIIPALLLQACCIHLFYARQQQSRALLNNAVWFCLQIPLLLIVPPYTAPHEAWPYIVSWGLAAYAAVAVSLIQLRTAPRLDRVQAWIREHRSTMSDLMVENVIGRISIQGSTWALGAVAGLRVLGGFRAAQMPYGLTRVFNVGMAPMALAEGVRIFQQSPARLRLLIRRWVALNGLMCLAVGGVLLGIPDGAGRAFAGDSWRYADAILVWVIVVAVSNAALVPAQTGLRCVGATRLAAKLRVITAPAPALFALIGGVYGDSETAVMGLALGSLLSAVVAMAAFEGRHRSEAARIGLEP